MCLIERGPRRVGWQSLCKNSSRVLLRHESDLLVLVVHQSRDSASTTTSPAGQVTSASLLVSTTLRRVCMIDTILRHGSIPNIGQYLGKDYTNILFQFKYFENQIVFSFCRTFMLLEVVGPARAKLCRVHCQCRTIAADIHCLCQWLSTFSGWTVADIPSPGTGDRFSY